MFFFECKMVKGLSHFYVILKKKKKNITTIICFVELAIVSVDFMTSTRTSRA